MLKRVTVENFIYFQERQTLEFDKGPYFLVGENDSGKSSFFEIIRRCMGISKSTGLSKPQDAAKSSIAVCCFLTNKNEQVVSAVMRHAKYGVYMKLVHKRSESKGNLSLEELEIDLVKEKNGKLIWKSVAVQDDLKKQLHPTEQDPWHVDVRSMLTNTEELAQEFDSNDSKSETTKCEELLIEHINKHTVVTFPLRSLSPCQWTESKRLNHNEKDNNIADVTQKEEIISWYLEMKDAKKISDEEIEQEKLYFDMITNGSDFSFKRSGEKVIVINKGKETDFLMLKVPEGIYEAKLLSIILAMSQFKTVCLEDPERGMHPQMIERIRDLVLMQITDKTVLLISHHPCFLGHWTVPRIFYFKVSDDHTTSKIISLQESKEHPSTGESDKTARIITSGQSAMLFFARRLLLVEGEGDFLFLTILRQTLLNKESLLFPYLRKTDVKEEVFRRFLCSLHILPMIGEANKFRYRDFCKRLEMPYFYILDHDALTQNIPGQDKNDKSPKRFLELFELNNDVDSKSVSENVHVLENHAIFVWRKTPADTGSGTIENAVMTFCEKHKQNQFLTENNINLRSGNNGEDRVKQHSQGAVKQEDTENNKEADQHNQTNDTPQASASTTEADNPDLPGKQQSLSLKKQKKRKKQKLFSDKKLTNKNINNVVKKIVELSVNDKESEFKRLIMFFVSHSK